MIDDERYWLPLGITDSCGAVLFSLFLLRRQSSTVQAPRRSCSPQNPEVVGDGTEAGPAVYLRHAPISTARSPCRRLTTLIRRSQAVRHRSALHQLPELEPQENLRDRPPPAHGQFGRKPGRPGSHAPRSRTRLRSSRKGLEGIIRRTTSDGVPGRPSPRLLGVSPLLLHQKVTKEGDVICLYGTTVRQQGENWCDT